MDSHISQLIFRLQRLPIFTMKLLPAHRIFHLHTVISTCGHEIVKNTSYKHDGLKRGNKPFVSLQYTLAGRGELLYKGKRNALLPGSVMLVITPNNFQYKLPKDSASWEFVYISFAGSEAIRISYQLLEQLGPVFDLTDRKTLILLEQTLQSLKYGDLSVFEMSSLGYSCLMSLLDAYLPQIADKKTDSKIEKIKQCCKERYFEPLQIDDFAILVNLSKYHLSRFFHARTGLTLQKYLESVRIEQSVEKLSSTNIPITKIALECGFKTSSYFISVFKKYYGYTPSDFRKMLN